MFPWLFVANRDCRTSAISALSNGDSEKASRFRELYRTLLTPVGLIVIISSVFYANLGAMTTYYILISSALLLLIVSLFLYSYSHMEVQKYRRRISQLAYGCMMFASFVSSAILVAPLFSSMIPGEDRTLIVDIAVILYLLVGRGATAWFCRTRV